MYYEDATGLVWTGHSNGGIRAWSGLKQESLLPLYRGHRSPVTAITTDEHGYCWAASGARAALGGS